MYFVYIKVISCIPNKQYSIQYIISKIIIFINNSIVTISAYLKDLSLTLIGLNITRPIVQ